VERNLKPSRLEVKISSLFLGKIPTPGHSDRRSFKLGTVGSLVCTHLPSRDFQVMKLEIFLQKSVSFFVTFLSKIDCCVCK